MNKHFDFDKIMSDRKLFNEVVYTPLSEALKILEERKKDKKLVAKVEELLKGNIPEILKIKKCAVLCRHIATPNKESIRFISIAKEHDLYPVFFEFHHDKFTPQSNLFKHSLGQIHVQEKNKNNGKYDIEKITIVDFNRNSGKKLIEVKTLWGESLVAFHRKLFDTQKYNFEDFYIYEGSKWYKENGGKAADYYTNFFMIFTCFGIMFENFLTSKETEGDFTKKIILPAIERVINITGVKPLIVPLEPLDIETEYFWYHHLAHVKKTIPK